MDGLVKLIQRIGIFMIAAQAVIHFAPEQKYEKYIKLIVGILVLLQFLSPLYNVLGKEGLDFGEWVSNLSYELEEGGMIAESAEYSSVSEVVIKNMEKEIERKLNQECSGENYKVINVRVSLDMADGENDNAGNRNPRYELQTVRVAVWEDDNREIADKEGGMGKIEKVQIQKIDIGVDSAKAGDREVLDTERENADELRKKFCNALGMEERYMEVILYGAGEKGDK